MHPSAANVGSRMLDLGPRQQVAAKEIISQPPSMCSQSAFIV